VPEAPGFDHVGRGSGCLAIVCFADCLGITDVDPMTDLYLDAPEYERTSPPDFDLDSWKDRDAIYEIFSRYGRDTRVYLALCYAAGKETTGDCGSLESIGLPRDGKRSTTS